MRILHTESSLAWGGQELRILTEAALSRKLPLVFLLSTYDAVDYASQTVACGASAYLAKAEFGPRVLETAWLAANANRHRIERQRKQPNRPAKRDDE